VSVLSPTLPVTEVTEVAAVRTSGRRMTAVVVAAAVLLVLGVLVALGSGETVIPLDDVARALLGQGDAVTLTVVESFRGPRVAAAVLVGAALGLSGAVLQSVVRNPLASPDVLGITSGASVTAVGVVVLAGTAGGVSGLAASATLPAAALAGGLIAAALLHALAVRGRRLEPMRLVVVGVGITAACTSLVAWLLTLGDVTLVGPALAWLAGSLHASTWPRLVGPAVALVVCVPWLVLGARRLDLLTLGDEVAAGLGVRVDRTRTLFLVAATALAATAVAASGAIGFLALCAPQLARRLCRAARPPLLAGGLIGAGLLVWADLVARRGLDWAVGNVTELPVGVVTAVLGAPYLLYVVARQRAAGTER
jgi:iron complex transport system permease protein